MELIFKVYNSKRYGMSESKGLINFATDITNKKSEELSEEKTTEKDKRNYGTCIYDEQRTVLAEV